jgi:hypothetical protein
MLNEKRLLVKLWKLCAEGHEDGKLPIAFIFFFKTVENSVEPDTVGQYRKICRLGEPFIGRPSYHTERSRRVRNWAEGERLQSCEHAA